MSGSDTFSVIWLLLADIFLSIEGFAICLFNSDVFNIAPAGATHAEFVIFGVILLAWAEVLGVKTYQRIAKVI